MKHKITEADKKAIAEAIKALERQSSAEVVTVISRSSDDYLYIPVLWAALGALAFPAVAMAMGSPWPPDRLYLVQLLLFMGLLLAGRIEALKMAVIPASVKKRRAANAARRHFFTLQLHRTGNRAAIMLFVSEAERYVEIITDVAVAEKIPDSEWEAVVKGFIERVRAGETVQGYLEAIERSGALLIPHFPYDPQETDELPNRLIML